jgi:Fe2+ transport system protein FeoA
MKLNELAEGSEFVLREVRFENKELIQNYLDIGILPGRKMKLLKKSPNLDKVILEISNQKIAIRFSDSKNLEVI